MIFSTWLFSRSWWSACPATHSSAILNLSKLKSCSEIIRNFKHPESHCCCSEIEMVQLQNHPKVTRPADALKYGIFKSPFICQSRPLLLFARQKLETQMCGHLEFFANQTSEQFHPLSYWRSQVLVNLIPSLLMTYQLLFQSVSTLQCWFLETAPRLHGSFYL